MGPSKRLALPFYVCLLATLLVGGFFVVVVLSRPAKTPILTLTGTYGPQWDLNAWVAEDINAIGALGEHTCSVQALPDIDHLAGGLWDAADEMLRSSLASCGDHLPLILYVNLHGAVNDEGAACWIPPSAQVNDATTWFPIERFLDHVAQAQRSGKHQPIVLLLECGRLRNHWVAGIGENQFDAKLGELAGQHQRKYPESNLTILNSASVGQRSLYSRLGDGDVFTRYLAEGLSGEADGFGQSTEVDGIVDLDELHQFVVHQVSRWAEHHRGMKQTPTLHRAHSSGDLPLARASRARRTDSHKTPPPSKADTQRLRSAAKLVVDLQQEDPISVDAHAWSKIQRTLRAIERSTYGGIAARKSTDRWYSRLNRQVQKLKQEIRERKSESAQLADVQLNRKAGIVWSALAKQPTPTAAAELVRELDADKPMPVPMLSALLERPGLGFWEDAAVIARTAKTQSDWLHATLELPDAIFPAADQVCEPVHECRRRLADAILSSQAGQSIGDQHPVELALRAFEKSVLVRTGMLADLTRAWRLRERAFLELPYLYQAAEDAPLAGPSITGPASPPSDHSDERGDGINSVMQLDSLLVSFVSETQPWNDELHDRITVVTERVMQYLNEMYSHHGIANLVVGGSEKASEPNVSMSLDAERMICAEEQLRRIDAAKSRETLPGPETMQTNKIAEVQRSQFNDVSQHQGLHAVDTGDVHAARPDYLAIMLDLDPETAAASIIRRQLRSLVDPSNDQTQTDQTGTQRWRRAVSLIVDDRFSEVISAARVQARRERMASRAAEVLDDFWYAPATNGTPYCIATAQSLMASANASEDKTAQWQTRRRAVQAKLDSRRLAAKSGIAVRAQWEPSYTRSDVTEVSVSVDRVEDQGTVPKGVGLLSLGHPGSEAHAEKPVSLEDDHSKPTSLAFEVTSSAASNSVAEVHFRGHLFRSSVAASTAAFGTAAKTTVSANRAKITVTDAMDARRSISFVLDCSASMNDRTNGESKRNDLNASAMTKFDAARSALYEMLRRLRPTRTEVGLVMYGHRMAMGSDDQGLLLQKRYHKRFPFPATIQPYEDVEVALPRGRFGEEELDLARQHFDAAVPWGQTPLYLAISRAIDDASRAGDATSKDVIVISDGRNYQFNPTPDAIVSADELIAKANQQGVRIHVIGFGLAGDEAVGAANDFATIANGTGGSSVTDVREATGLLRRLEELAADQTFTVELAGGKRTTATFGQTLELDPIETTDSAVKVTVAEKQSEIPVSPGDHLLLIANRMKDSLSAKPYLVGAPQFVNLVTSDDMTLSTRVGVQVPELYERDCRFRVSIQSSDRRVVQRPATLWIEVRPKRAHLPASENQMESGVYRIGKCQWLANMPCPVAEFSCICWPTDATGYELQVWSADHTIAGQVLELDSVKGDVSNAEFPGLPGVRYEVRTTEEAIEVGIDYGQREKPNTDAMLAVDLEGASDVGCEHWYDENGRHSFHRFRLANSTGGPAESGTAIELNAAQAPDNAHVDQASRTIKLRVCTIAQLKAECVRSARSLEGPMHPSIATASATSKR